MPDDADLNLSRVIRRIEEDIETVLTAYEYQRVQSEVVMVALLKVLHSRVKEQGIPFERIFTALKLM